jgi:Kef-type K+ transport system membrane component KefB
VVDIALIRSLGIIIVAGALFALAARAFSIPTIVAYLMAGLVIGPVSGAVSTNETLDLISHVGIALLLFLVGLEISLEKLKGVGRVTVVAGLVQIVLTALGGWLIATFLGFGAVASLLLATALTFSSTVVVVKLLGEKGELNSQYGRIAVGIFLVQDMVAILILTFLSGLDTGTAATPASVALGMLRAFGGMSLLFLITAAAARFILPRPFTWAASSPDTLFIASLAWCFLLALGTEALHLSMEIGAFLAGIALAQLPFHQELHRRVHPLMNFFIAVFFITLGIKMEIDPARVNWLAAFVFSVFVLIVKPALLIPVISRMGYGLRTSFLAGTSVAQISEFSFILLAVGMSQGLVGADVLATGALVGLMTFAVSSYMIIDNRKLLRKAERSGLLRLFGPDLEVEAEEPAPPQRGGHVIVVGMNSLGREIALRLHDRGEVVLAIDTDPAKLTDLPCETMMGSVEYLSLLLEAGLPRAKLVVSAALIEEANDLLAYRCSTFDVPCAIHAIDLSVIDNLLTVNTTYLLIPKVDGIKLQTKELKRLGFLR